MTTPSPSSPSKYTNYETLRATFPEDGILHVELNRPRQLNAMNPTFWRECRELFEEIHADSDVRAVVLSSNAKIFTAGLDIMSPPPELIDTSERDPGRRGYKLYTMIKRMQSAFTSIEKCHKPVIVCIHSLCLGAGVDLITACDVRLATKDVVLSVKEVDLGLAADIGTLQRLPKVVGNHSAVREWCLTGRNVSIQEAKEVGLVSKVFEDKAAMMDEAFKIARIIKEKSPVAIVGTKHCLNHARDHSVDEGLEYMSSWNAAYLQTVDIPKALDAAVKKKKVLFAKL